MLCRIESTRAGRTLKLTVSSLGAALPFVDRTVDLLSGPGGEFAVPPAADKARWTGQPHQALCEATDAATIGAVYRRILTNEPQPGEVALFGRYLAEVLLGPNLEVIEAQTTAIDLRLRLTDGSSERLPWEMMHSAAGPLSARPAHRLSITREIAREAAAGAAPAAAAATTLDLPLPLKVLFVVGATIDPVLRPGAEFLGLLRHLRIPTDPTFKEFRSASVNIRYLGDADIDSLKEACKSFQPSVVHFICHGEREAATKQTRIVLKRVVPHPGQRMTEPFPLTSGELMDAFAEAGHVPSAVVLNACYAGGANADEGTSDDGHLPFAADLVKRGVAVAVGMAGEVDDRACQLFALRFYQALLATDRFPITDAMSQARRAVLAGWPAYQQSVEWSRPTLFMRAGLDPAIVTQRAQTLDVIEKAERFRLVSQRPVMLSDRYDVLAAAQQLFEMADRPGNERMLVAVRVDAEKGLGKTRLLEEIAVRSLFDRFVPVILRANADPPQTFLEFALSISEAMDETRQHLELDPVLRTRARAVAFGAVGLNDDIDDDEFASQRHKLRKLLRALTPAGGQVEPAEVLDAIKADCAQLAAKVTEDTKVAHRVLILIDELHRYSGAITPILDSIQYAGLGTPKSPIPVVINYVDSSPEGGEIKQKLQHLPLARRPDLKRFERDPERYLAYRQMIASLFKVTPNPERTKKTAVQDFFAELHSTTGGRPGEFVNPFVEYLIRGVRLADQKLLVDANYEKLLTQFGDQ